MKDEAGKDEVSDNLNRLTRPTARDRQIVPPIRRNDRRTDLDATRDGIRSVLLWGDYLKTEPGKPA